MVLYDSLTFFEFFQKIDLNESEYVENYGDHFLGQNYFLYK